MGIQDEFDIKEERDKISAEFKEIRNYKEFRILKTSSNEK
ncbi:hypothetical protein LEP1GSC193_0477 [Leptospira alstonii serovar Pingchang str. 80-412]|uniref:Uncharacterized protein n=2 Tax=Leptospira alstonii TaxID=28452 RepID=M6CVM0_9LEPT|nr:hypothetical protein LEP1GSC194_1420 [Leptospira alstonii serovar Sichuan str. 79601]EQA79578.1 hypothetical protein LEP1GSC193_0477 [Leptospira alstonii serovar Pingchang str. 80-412]